MNWDTLKDPSENEYFQFIDEKRNVFKVYPIVKQLCIQWALSENNKVLGTYLKAENAQEEINKRYRRPHKPGDVVERKWGKYRVMLVGEKYLIKELYFNPGQKISYQSHKNRKEQWLVIKGDGVFRTEQQYSTSNYFGWDYEYFYGGVRKRYLTAPPTPLIDVRLGKKIGDSLVIEKEQKHQFIAGPNGATILETWYGELDECDIIRFEEN